MATVSTAFDVDITSPTLENFVGPSDFDVGAGVSTVLASLGGDISDANGIAKAEVTGLHDNSLGTGCPGVLVFTIDEANIDVIDLGVGPTFSVTYTLKNPADTGSATLSVTPVYSYPISVWDPTLFIDGTMAGNPNTTTCANQNGDWQ